VLLVYFQRNFDYLKEIYDYCILCVPVMTRHPEAPLAAGVHSDVALRAGTRTEKEGELGEQKIVEGLWEEGGACLLE
jgi:hypothetical protein